MARQEDPVQWEIHHDWIDWEYTEVITSSSKKSQTFSTPSLSCHSRLVTLQEKLTALGEQKIHINVFEVLVFRGQSLGLC
uniref:Uncharacterized protein n=1 Tax=Sciurus vulgaris TaxID=55149 RepID=A0A8D2AYB2_SCIVU